MTSKVLDEVLACSPPSSKHQMSLHWPVLPNCHFLTLLFPYSILYLSTSVFFSWSSSQQLCLLPYLAWLCCAALSHGAVIPWACWTTATGPTRPGLWSPSSWNCRGRWLVSRQGRTGQYGGLEPREWCNLLEGRHVWPAETLSGLSWPLWSGI